MQEALKKEGQIMSKTEIFQKIEKVFSVNNRRRMAVLVEGQEFFEIPKKSLCDMSYFIIERDVSK